MSTHRCCSVFPFLASVFASFALAVSPVTADYYSGDPYSAQAAWPQYTEYLSNSNQILALTYDNFNWVPGSGGGLIGSVGGYFHSFNTVPGTVINKAYWEFRTGMSHNVGGSLIASGNGTVSPFATSFTQGGSAVWGFDVDIPDFTLAAGNYWFGLALGTTSTDPNATSWFVASTTGTNGIGGPLGDNLSIYFQSQFGNQINWDYVESTIVNPTFSGMDPSYFIQEVPEPSSMLLCALIAGLTSCRRQRRRM